MQVNLEVKNNSAIFQLDGMIDEGGSELLKREFTNLDIDGISEVIIDFRHVVYIGSSGIGKLLLFYKDLGVKQIRLKVINVTESIYEIFKELKLDTIFWIEKKLS